MSVCLCPQFSVCSVLFCLIVLLIILSAGLSLFPSSLYLLVRTYLFITIDLLLSTFRLTLVLVVHRPSGTIDRFGIVEAIFQRLFDRAGPTVSVTLRPFNPAREHAGSLIAILASSRVRVCPVLTVERFLSVLCL